MSEPERVEPVCTGTWFEKATSRSIDAGLIRRGDRLTIQDGDGTPLADLNALHVSISDRVGNIPRRLTFADAGTFETLDNDAIDALETQATGWRAQLVHSLERFHPRLIALVVVAGLLIAGIFRFGLPVLVEAAVRVTPPGVPALMSEGTLRAMDRTVLQESQLTDKRATALRAGFAELASHSRHPPEHYKLLFRSTDFLGPNALALPDGTIILTDQLVAMAPDDDMLLAVMGHEIGHIELQHSLREFYRTAGIAAMIMMMVGDIGPIVEDVLVQGTLLLQLSYSREAEMEADLRSVELMHAAGFDPAAIGGFFALLTARYGETPGESGYLSTHPATSARRDAVQSYADEIRSQGSVPQRD